MTPTLSRPYSTLLLVERFVSALCVSLWVGGMAFFGIMAAPVLFHPERSGILRESNTAIIAPQMVSAMLTRFGTLTTICGAVLLVCALIDGFLTRGWRVRTWQIQTVLCAVCLGFSLYLNSFLLPQTKRDQAQILPLIARSARGETLSPADTAQRAAFDAGHSSYQRLASLNLYLLLALLFVILARTASGDASGAVVPKAAQL